MWRRGPRVCVRVYARVLVPPNLYIHTHTYIIIFGGNSHIIQLTPHELSAEPKNSASAEALTGAKGQGDQKKIRQPRIQKIPRVESPGRAKFARKSFSASPHLMAQELAALHAAALKCKAAAQSFSDEQAAQGFALTDELRTLFGRGPARLYFSHRFLLCLGIVCIAACLAAAAVQGAELRPIVHATEGFFSWDDEAGRFSPLNALSGPSTADARVCSGPLVLLLYIQHSGNDDFVDFREAFALHKSFLQRVAAKAECSGFQHHRPNGLTSRCFAHATAGACNRQGCGSCVNRTPSPCESIHVSCRAVATINEKRLAGWSQVNPIGKRTCYNL